LRVAGEARKRLDIAIGFFQPVQPEIQIGLEQVEIGEWPDFTDSTIDGGLRGI